MLCTLHQGQLLASVASLLKMPTTMLLWRTFDNVFLLQMGHAYQVRFWDFVGATEDGGLNATRDWRKEQQEEWDRLSLSVSLHSSVLCGSFFMPR